MSEARTPSPEPTIRADDAILFAVRLAAQGDTYPQRTKRLERVESNAWDLLAEAEERANVYPLRSGLRPPQMDAARIRMAALARLTLEAVRIVRQQNRDGSFGPRP